MLRISSKPKIRIGQRASISGPEDALTYRKYLSSFQVEKFTYLFDALFDIQKNGLLERDDIDALVEKLRAYAGWDKTDERYQEIVDVHRVFYECLLDQVLAEKHASAEAVEIPSWTEARKPDVDEENSIGLTQWLNMWGRMCYRSSGMSDFPIWVQILPNIFFNVIDRDKDGVLRFEEMKAFYEDFVGIGEKEINDVANEGYRALTAGGEYSLTRSNYMYCFANFLLGRTIFGPGKYIFGVFDNQEINKPFTVIYNEEEDEEEK